MKAGTAHPTLTSTPPTPQKLKYPLDTLFRHGMIGAMKTVIYECGRCQHEYQDKKYGKNRRVFNVRFDEKKGGTCTVCGNQSSLKGSLTEEAPKNKTKTK
jgi:hypothetical protein